MTLEYKKRRKADTCDVAKCRARGGLTVTEETHDDGKRVKLCAKHLPEGGTNAAASPPPSPAAIPDNAHPQSSAPSQHDAVLAIVEPVRTEAEANAGALASIVIGSQDMLDKAGALLQQTKAQYKSLEAERTKVTKPLLDAKRAIDGWFDPAKVALKELEGVLKSAMSGFVTGQEQKRLEALQLGQHEAALAVEQPIMPSGVSTRTTWRFNVVDEAKVPREYLVLDMAKVQAHVSHYKSNSAIPGIEAYPDTGIAATAKAAS